MQGKKQESATTSKLLPVLREGVCVVQMVLFKELRNHFLKKYEEHDTLFHSMLAGAVINELFGIQNPEEKIQNFRRDNQGTIEQVLLGLASELPELRPYITDALRIQILCDHQEGVDTSSTLIAVEELGLLITEREIPLPSTFMTRLRLLGEKHGLTVAPVQISQEDDNTMVQ